MASIFAGVYDDHAESLTYQRTLPQAAKRKARGYTNLTTMRTVLFLIAGKLDFSKINPHVL